MAYYIKTDIDDDDEYEYSYELKLISEFNDKIKEGSTTMPLPGESATESIIMALEGETQEITISFLIYDDGTNRAIDDDETNTAPDAFTDDTVETIEEQKEYLMDYIKKTDIGVQNYISSRTYTDRKCKITNLTFREVSDQPLRLACDMTLKVGGAI